MVLTPVAVSAGPPGEGKPRAAREYPTVHGNLPGPVRRQLTLGFRLAAEEIRRTPSCSALFSRFHADGVQLLAALDFEASTSAVLGDTCSRVGVTAFTTVGGRKVRLCPHFGDLEVPAAAMILIHEVLHAAGLTERPADPHGLLPQEINRLVAVNCSR